MKLVAASFGVLPPSSSILPMDSRLIQKIKSQVLISADEDRRQIYTTGSNAAAGDVAAV